MGGEGNLPVIQAVVDFTIVAFAIFIAVKAINKLKRKEEITPTAPPPPSAQEMLLTEIRGLWKSNHKNSG